MTDRSKPQRLRHIVGNRRAPQHRQPLRLPQSLDVCIVEGLVESLPQRQKRTIERRIHAAEQQNDVTEPHE